MLCAPRGAGKTHYLLNLASKTRAAHQAVQWIDAEEPLAGIGGEYTDLLLIDGLNSAEPTHVSLLRRAVSSVRQGQIKQLVFATRGTELANSWKYPWLSGCKIMHEDQLAMNRVNIKRFAAGQEISLPDWAVEVLWNETHGWPLAVSLGLAAYQNLNSELANELRVELHYQLRTVVSGFLSQKLCLVFAVAAELDDETLETMGYSASEASQLLVSLEAEGWLAKESAGARYRVPHAIAQAMKNDQKIDTAELERLRVLLVQYYLKEKRVADAIDIAAESNTPELSAVVLRHCLLNGKFASLGLIARALKNHRLEWFSGHDALLCSTILSDRGSNRDYADWRRAVEDLKSYKVCPNGDGVEAFMMFSAQTVLHRITGDLKTSLHHALNAVQAWHSTREKQPELAGVAALALESAASTFFFNGERRRTMIAQREAVYCAKALEDQSMARVSTTTLFGINALHGDMVGAAAASNSLDRLRDVNVPAYIAAWESTGNALLAVENGDADEARNHARALVHAANGSENWWLAEYVNALVEHSAGRSQVGKYFSERIARGLSRGWLIHVPAFYDVCVYELKILDGHVLEVKRNLQRQKIYGKHLQILSAAAELALSNWSTAIKLATHEPKDVVPLYAVLRNLVLAASYAGQKQHEQALTEMGEAVDRMDLWSSARALQYLSKEARSLLMKVADDLEPGKRQLFMANLEKFAPLEISRAALVPLTKREAQILPLLGTGDTRLEIAEQLDISINTLKTLIARIYRKLEVNDVTSAIDKAQQLGYLPKDVL